jgi:hypothetical protein
MVSFSFYGELQARCYFVKAFQDVVYVRFASIVDDENIVYAAEIAFNIVVCEEVINIGAL